MQYEDLVKRLPLTSAAGDVAGCVEILRQATRHADHVVARQALFTLWKLNAAPDTHFFAGDMQVSLPLRTRDTLYDSHLSGFKGWERHYNLEPFGMPEARVPLLWDKTRAQLLAADYAEACLVLWRKDMQPSPDFGYLRHVIKECRNNIDCDRARETNPYLRQVHGDLVAMSSRYMDVLYHIVSAVRHATTAYPRDAAAHSALRAFYVNYAVTKQGEDEDTHMRWQKDVLVEYYTGARAGDLQPFPR